jgi:hypothetical protein
VLTRNSRNIKAQVILFIFGIYLSSIGYSIVSQN